MTIELSLLRHAHAGDPGAWDGPDERRPLTGKGRAQVERLAGHLLSIGWAPGIVLSSPKTRALETAQLLARPLGVEVVVDDRLAGDLDLAGLEQMVRSACDVDRVNPMLVGHDPELSVLAALLCGAARLPMKKGALARIDIHLPLSPAAGTLRWLLPPSLLG